MAHSLAVTRFNLSRVGLVSTNPKRPINLRNPEQDLRSLPDDSWWACDDATFTQRVNDLANQARMRRSPEGRRGLSIGVGETRKTREFQAWPTGE